jgi:hypothetical protein
MRTAWIPEAPNHPGLYANLSGTDIRSEGKVDTSEMQPSTMSAEHARQFPSREECQAWCDANPHPVFVPTEHSFED